MEFRSILPDQWILGLGVIFILSSCAVLAISKRQRDAVLSRLDLHRRRTSGASTPPRSISPDKKGPYSPAAEKTLAASSCPAVDFVNTFPPSRRCALPEVFGPGWTAETSETASDCEPNLELLQTQGLSSIKTYDPLISDLKYTPTGFSTKEIEAMGDFPAYDVLSGVPLPEPYTDFNPSTALPRPFRPFRWAYHQTMSLTKLEPDWWLEIEKTYVSRVKQRQGLFEKYGKDVLDYLPGSELACKELMEMCLQFYCARYPNYFTLSDDRTTFHNRLLGTKTIIKSMHPLHVLLNNVPEDFAIVLRNENDGMYYFRAGTICSSLGWNVGTKIGMQLRDIHKPIPDYKEKMAFSMDRYFSKMPTNAPIQRGSWGLEVDSPLYMPPGDPHEKLRLLQKEDLKIEDCNLRVDWQTLRRLPLSSAIVFNFKAVFTPVQEFRDEPYIPSLLLKIMKEGKKNLMEYKNTWHVEHVCIPEFERYEQEQISKGTMKLEDGETTWTVATLPESPFFNGWEEKWHRQQGF